MNTGEQQYLDLLQKIKNEGWKKPVFFTPEVLAQYESEGLEAPYIKSVFGHVMRFDMADGFPLLTTKKVFTRGIIIELLWFLKGDSNIKYLVDNDVPSVFIFPFSSIDGPTFVPFVPNVITSVTLL